MDKDKILQQIKINNLNNLNYEFIIAQLCVLNNRPFNEVKDILDKLILSGKVQVATDTPEYSENIKKNKPRVQSAIKVSNKKQFSNNSCKIVKLEGTIQGTKSDFAFLIPFNNEYQDVFIAGRNLNGAINSDIVVVEARLVNGGKKLDGKVVKILQRGNENIVGKIFIKQHTAYVTPDDVKFGKDVLVPLSKTMGAENGTKVIVKIKEYANSGNIKGGCKNPTGYVIEILGKPDEIETEVKACIRSYNLFEDFPNKVLEYTATLPSEVNVEKYPNRKDLRKLNCFTIDGEDSRDLDDAISISKNDNGTFKLGVHIADVSEYVGFGNVLDNEAFKRGTSVYFPSLVIPMLPRELSNGICSLNEGETRLALSVFMDINASGIVVDYNIVESIIESKKRFTYTEVTRILKGEDVKNPFTKDLLLMNELNYILIKMREKRGALDFDIPEVKIQLNDLGDVLEVQKAPRDDSHRLIESFMVAANETIAAHYKKIKAPFVYRVHEAPDAEKMLNFIRIAKKMGVKTLANPENVAPLDLQEMLTQVNQLDGSYMLNRICLRSLKKAKYNEQCLGHYGLASIEYCHFTSPIRRYPDLTIHRIIKADLRGRLKGNYLTKQRQFVVASSMHSSDREQLSEKVERDVDDLYKVYYMTHHINEVFEGRVSGVAAFGIFIELENTVEGLVKVGDLPDDYYTFDEDNFELRGAVNNYTLGKVVKVKCVGANILSREVDFVLAE